MQLRPETEAADDEYQAFLRATGLSSEKLVRARMEEGFPEVNLDEYSGVIVGGGPSNVSDPEDKKPGYQKDFEEKLTGLLAKITQQDYPYFGECYGLSALARFLDEGSVSKEKYGETVSALTVTLTQDGQNDPLLRGISGSFRAFGGHKESCQRVPKGTVLLASSEKCPVHMVRYKRNVYGSQFHPELDSYGLEVRINTYKHAGYFPPEDAERMIELGHKETVTVPAEILRRFVSKYQR